LSKIWIVDAASLDQEGAPGGCPDVKRHQNYRSTQSDAETLISWSTMFFSRFLWRARRRPRRANQGWLRIMLT